MSGNTQVYKVPATGYTQEQEVCGDDADQSVRKTVKGTSRWGCVAAIGTFVLLMNSQEYKDSSDSGKTDWTVLHSANRY